MTNITIKSFNEYKKEYDFTSPLCTQAIYEQVNKLALNKDIRKTAKNMKSKTLNAKRGKSALDEILFHYIAYYLMNFIALDSLYNERVIFNHLYTTIKNTSDYQKNMSIQLLKNIVNEIRQ